MTLDARERAAPQLLRALRGDVDEKKAARDRRRRFLSRFLDWFCAVVGVNHAQ
jgi:hypothetical protein